MRNKYMLIGLVGIVVGVLLASVVAVLAGTNFDSPSGPTDSGSQMYTLEQIYDRANDGTAATPMGTFTEPDSGPAATMYDLNALYTLVSERSRPAKTGQTKCYDASSEQTCPVTGFPGQDGDLQKGVSWPTTRFTDNGNGTVMDNLTGLIWLANANCNGAKTWAEALTWANGLYDGCGSCGGTNNDCNLSDSSTAGQWRLPNVRELFSLIDFSQYNPALPSSHPFGGVQSNFYWSSTTLAIDTATAWSVNLNYGYVNNDVKMGTYYVWPVRSGQ